MAPTIAVPAVLTDPGYLFIAPIGSTVPANTVVGSKYTDAWPVAWRSLGATADGSTFDYNTKVDPVKVAEFFDPIAWKTTERAGMFSFALVNINMTNVQSILNGGTTTVTGTTTTTNTDYVPPVPGSEVRCMIGWESWDNTVRIVAYQCFQGGSLQMKFNAVSSAERTSMPATFNFEVPSSGNPFRISGAGVARA